MTDKNARLLEDLRDAHRAVALLVAEDDCYLPLFAHLDRELAALEQVVKNNQDPVAKARELLRQRAIA